MPERPETHDDIHNKQPRKRTDTLASDQGDSGADGSDDEGESDADSDGDSDERPGRGTHLPFCHQCQKGLCQFEQLSSVLLGRRENHGLAPTIRRGRRHPVSEESHHHEPPVIPLEMWPTETGICVTSLLSTTLDLPVQGMAGSRRPRVLSPGTVADRGQEGPRGRDSVREVEAAAGGDGHSPGYDECISSAAVG